MGVPTLEEGAGDRPTETRQRVINPPYLGSVCPGRRESAFLATRDARDLRRLSLVGSPPFWIWPRFAA
jgi:hypothetical protein